MQLFDSIRIIPNNDQDWVHHDRRQGYQYHPSYYQSSILVQTMVCRLTDKLRRTAPAASGWSGVLCVFSVSA